MRFVAAVPSEPNRSCCVLECCLVVLGTMMTLVSLVSWPELPLEGRSPSVYDVFAVSFALDHFTACASGPPPALASILFIYIFEFDSRCRLRASEYSIVIFFEFILFNNRIYI